MTDALDVRIEWLDAPGVTTPELAATWARYEVWVGGRCVTQIEAPDGTLRRSVYGALYPLAEWIASNWWILASHIRPSAVETRYWTWPNVRAYPWLANHNVRGAGDGMAWPNLTLIVEGAVTHVTWVADTNYTSGHIRFASSGVTIVRTDGVIEGLARIVNHALERLAEEGLPKTQLAEEWDAIAKVDGEEREFCQTVARLGLDPYSVSEQTAADVVNIASSLPTELAADFFDSADATALAGAAEWTQRALAAANKASGKARARLRPLYEAVSSYSGDVAIASEVVADVDRPWAIGYAMAQRVRSELGVGDTEQFDTSPWVGVSDLSAPSRGVQGVATVNQDRCGLVLGRPRLGVSANRFGQARALGRVLSRPEQRRFVLSLARGHDEKVAGAFAAELLAPAEGIRHSLDSLGKSDDAAMEAVAQHYRVSPLLVRHQYDNQIARTAYRPSW